MSLPGSSRHYEGQLSCFAPRHGWGWFRRDARGGKEPVDYAGIDRAGDFHLRARRFFASEGELRGVVGRVEQPGHPFDGPWAAAWTMLVGEYDLTDRLCWRWDIELGPREPGGDGWPAEPDTPPAYFGTGGVLAASRAAADAWWASNITGSAADPGLEGGPGGS